VHESVADIQWGPWFLSSPPFAPSGILPMAACYPGCHFLLAAATVPPPHVRSQPTRLAAVRDLAAHRRATVAAGIGSADHRRHQHHPTHPLPLSDKIPSNSQCPTRNMQPRTAESFIFCFVRASPSSTETVAQKVYSERIDRLNHHAQQES
jgi:hypothetical protein